jgi:beta-galactosidase
MKPRPPAPTLLSFMSLLVALPAAALRADPAPYAPPASPRAVYDFNPGWKFQFGDSAGASAPGFDDSRWAPVSLPHTWNETDSYRAYISHSGGDQSETHFGIGWYRKHFRLPPGAEGGKVFLEFDGLRQAARFFVNGQPVGMYENGVTALGLDITAAVAFAGRDNLLAVQVDNDPNYKEQATGVPFEWNAKDFNPNFGGLNRDARLILTGPIYQTLPLYENLKTTGIYVYPQSIDLKARQAEVAVEAEVANETADYASITLSAVVVDASGAVRARFESDPSDLVAGQSEVFKASGLLPAVRLWDVDDPYLYTVYTILTANGKVADVCRTQTGFRHTEFKGGAGTGGVWLNGRFVWLTGYSQRSADDWAGLGGAYPDWMHDYTLSLLRASNGNYLRWMHVAPQRADVAACDRYGVVEVCPAGDKERLVTGRQWEQRAEVMRDTMILYRNHPSILFWEAGNTIVTPDQMREMVGLRQQWDPHGGRVMGTRDNDLADANKALTPLSEYYGVMIGQAPQTDQVKGDEIFRGYSVARRDRAPLIETEDFRDEAGRDVWDDYSPPHFGFKPHLIAGATRPGPGGDTYHWNSETFCLAAATRYAAYVRNRIDNPDPAHSKWSAYSSIYFTDSDADGRQDGSYVLRVSGKMDAVRLPKEVYFVSRVMQSTRPDVHIIGHWTYPAGTVKTVYVAATPCDQVELFLNGRFLGVQTRPTVFVDPFKGAHVPGSELVQRADTGFIYAFPAVRFAPGTLRAVVSQGGRTVAADELQTAGEPKALRLTVHTHPGGLLADGSDVALIDFEAVDADGRRCPTDEARVDFAVSGPAVWRGGLNSAKLNSTNNLYLDTECGINRVAVRSTETPGTITVTASRPGLAPATAVIPSRPVAIDGGLEPEPPPRF